MGTVLTRTSPPASVAAQREAEAQETPVMAPFPTVAGPTQDDAPASGLELAKTRPERSPATHSPEELQETELNACSPSIRCRLHFADGEPAIRADEGVAGRIHRHAQPFGGAGDPGRGAAFVEHPRAPTSPAAPPPSRPMQGSRAARACSPGTRIASSRYPRVLRHLAPSNAPAGPELRSRGAARSWRDARGPIRRRRALCKHPRVRGPARPSAS